MDRMFWWSAQDFIGTPRILGGALNLGGAVGALKFGEVAPL